MATLATREATMRLPTIIALATGLTLALAGGATVAGYAAYATGRTVHERVTAIDTTDADNRCRTAVLTYGHTRADQASNTTVVATVASVDLDSTTRQPNGTVRVGATIHYVLAAGFVTVPQAVQVTCTATKTDARVTQP